MPLLDDDGHIHPSWHQFLTSKDDPDIPNVLDWGGTDFEARLNAAITALEANGGGTLRVNPGVYTLASEVLIQQPILLDCRGYGDVSTAASGDSTRLVTFRRSGSTAAPMFRFQASTDTAIIRGGGIIGAMLDGANIATIGIHGRSVQFQTYDIATWSMVNSGIRIDEGNNANSAFNRIWLHFVYGTGATPASAHGLHLRGEDGTGGCTQNIIMSINGLHDDGHMVFIDGNVDNNTFIRVNSPRQTGGTGYGIYLGAGAASHARENTFVHFAGRVYAEDGTFANTFVHWTSEAGSLELESTTGAHVVVHHLSDFGNGARYETPRYPLKEEIPVSAMMMYPYTTFRSIGTLWAGLSFDDASTETAWGHIPAHFTRSAGTITGVRLSYLMASTNTTDDVVFQVRMGSHADGATVTTAEANQTFTFTVEDSTGVLGVETLTLSSPLSVALGNEIFFRFDRLGGDGNDTATGDFVLISATFLFESSGPVNPANTWNIPPMKL